ncbi:MAG: hypothetical protein V4649_07975 [Bacteroidota bacterium]
MTVCMVHAKIKELTNRNVVVNTNVLATELGTNTDIVNEYIMALQILELVRLTAGNDICLTNAGTFMQV